MELNVNRGIKRLERECGPAHWSTTLKMPGSIPNKLSNFSYTRNEGSFEFESRSRGSLIFSSFIDKKKKDYSKRKLQHQERIELEHELGDSCVSSFSDHLV